MTTKCLFILTWRSAMSRLQSTRTAICGDMGPVVKIGEGSIATHAGLKGAAPDPCKRDSPDGPCKRIHDSSIEQDVLFFVFPHSALGSELTASNLEAKVSERALALFAHLRSSGG